MKNRKWMNPVIIVLSILLVVLVVATAGEIQSYFTRYYGEEDTFLYNVRDKFYYRLPQQMYGNLAGEYEGNEHLEEYYAIARYFEASSFYYAYKAEGNNQKAGEYYDIMQEQIPLITTMPYAINEIDSIFINY